VKWNYSDSDSIYPYQTKTIDGKKYCDEKNLNRQEQSFVEIQGVKIWEVFAWINESLLSSVFLIKKIEVHW